MEKKSLVLDALNNLDNLQEHVKSFGKNAIKKALNEQLEDIAKNINENDDEEDEIEVNNADSMDGDNSLNNEPMGDDTNLSTDTPEETPEDGLDEPDMDSNLDEPSATDNPLDDEEELVDLTNVDNDELVKTIELAEPASQIEVVQTENGVTINIKNQSGDMTATDGVEDIDSANSVNADPSLDNPEGMSSEPELGNDAENLSDEPEMTPDMDNTEEPDQDEEDENKVFEINLTTGDVSKDEHDTVKKQLKELRKKYTSVLNENSKYKKINNELNEKVEKLAKITNEYDKTIQKLSEGITTATVRFATTHNLANLLQEVTLTKDEKQIVLEKFNNVSSAEEAESLYETLSAEYKSKNSQTDTIIENKVLGGTNGTSSSSSSKQMINEQQARILRLMYGNSKNK